MDATTHNRKPIDKALRRKLEATVIEAREVAEQAAAQALNRLSVGESAPEDYLDEQQRKLRNRLRAHGRQLGDIRRENGVQGIKRLATEVAYEHWHRMLFARFLEQNQLLMYDADINVTLADCDELIRDGVFQDDMEAHCSNGWELAAVLASKMLPQIFRIDSPVFELQFAPEHQRKLEQLVTGLAPETFQAQDSLGWVYQFWQTKRKEEVNKSEVKIGADELSPVTQLFTEHYMVSFLLDNALGAWWAGQRLTDEDWKNAENEQELRDKAAISGVPLSYLRFVKDDDGQWAPASGKFEAWPQQLSELKTLDPCCGSGHFLVATFLMLVPMRMEMETLDAKKAVDKVLAENLHGLELDQRCVELAAFALALEAWRYPNAGRYRSLPEMHLACSGLSIAAARGEWKELSRKAGKQNLTIGLDLMYDTFRDAPVLGSLINPRRSNAAKVAKWDELQVLLSEALEQEESRNPKGPEETERVEAGIAAKGITKAAELLAGKYQWVITNVPYLARGKQSDTLRNFCEEYYPAAKNDLATVFLDRCLEFCVKGGTSSIVLPQNWLFLTSYKRFREKLLQSDSWHLIARLGPGAFETISGEVVKAILINMSAGTSNVHSTDLLYAGEQENLIRGLDVSAPRTAAEKAASLLSYDVKSVGQVKQLENPDARVAFHETIENVQLLIDYVDSYEGIGTGDLARFQMFWWESLISGDCLVPFRTTSEVTKDFSGYTGALLWESGEGEMVTNAREQNSRPTRGFRAWGRQGIAINRMRNLESSLFLGQKFDCNIAAVIPKSPEHLPAIWAFCSSPEYPTLVREIDQALKVTNHTLVKVPFDLDYWSKIADEKYPNQLPKPYTDDPSQWIFHGHPCGSVVWDEKARSTAHGNLRVDDTVLHVAVARLLGHRWPAELDPEMELAVEQREWIQHCQDLALHVDDDGIVCLPAVRGEKSADQRLEALLQEAYGHEWTILLKNRLLETVGSKSLNLWLRDKFFEQHCKLFQHRPFIWHVWDGLKDGFSVLVNYHKVDKAGLERLIYTYLGDWIRTQQTAVADGEDGADVRLAAAQTLKKELEAILEGEALYDVFVRWKPLEKQPIGWSPDLNDGVRLNIRPFMKAKDLGKKGAGILRAKPNIHWNKDRGKDVPSAPWYSLGLEHGEKEGARINDHHLSLDEKKKARS
jgi:hypothetical protein